MHIRGQIIENSIPLDGCSAYLVKEQERRYLVFASGIQSANDCVFVSKGQEIEITGNYISEIEGVVLPDRAKIELRGEKNFFQKSETF